MESKFLLLKLHPSYCLSSSSPGGMENRFTWGDNGRHHAPTYELTHADYHPSSKPRRPDSPRRL